MKNVKPIYIKILIAAAVAYIIAMTFMVSGLCYKVGQLEHESTCKATEHNLSH